MNSPIRNAHGPTSAHELSTEQATAKAPKHAKRDPFASSHYKGRKISQTNGKSLSKSRLAKALSERPERSSTNRPTGAGNPAKPAFSGTQHARSTRGSYTDRNRNGNGNGGGAGGQQRDDDDAPHTSDTPKDEPARKAKFAVSNKKLGVTLTLAPTNPLLESTSNEQQGPDQQLSLCQKFVERVRLLVAPASDPEQAKRFNLQKPLMAHQATSLPRTQAQSVRAEAVLDLLARNTSSPGRRTIYELMLALLAGRRGSNATVDWPMIKAWLCGTPPLHEGAATSDGDRAKTGLDTKGEPRRAPHITHGQRPTRPI